MEDENISIGTGDDEHLPILLDNGNDEQFITPQEQVLQEEKIHKARRQESSIYTHRDTDVTLSDEQSLQTEDSPREADTIESGDTGTSKKSDETFDLEGQKPAVRKHNFEDICLVCFCWTVIFLEFGVCVFDWVVMDGYKSSLGFFFLFILVCMQLYSPFSHHSFSYSPNNYQFVYFTYFIIDTYLYSLYHFSFSIYTLLSI